MYLFSNILGVFVFDNEFKIADEMLFSSADDYNNRGELIAKIKNKHKNAGDK